MWGCGSVRAVFLIVLGLGSSALSGGERPEGSVSARSAQDSRIDNGSESWRTINRCGINSCYLLLRLSGLDVSYRVLTEELPAAERGADLKSMRDVLQKHGLSVRVILCDMNQLGSTSLPAIAHVESDRYSSSDGLEAKPGGHYVVVLEETDRHVRYIDGTTAVVIIEPKDRFLREWSGYLLVARSRGPNERNVIVFLALGLLAGACGWSLLLRGVRVKDQLQK